ncbi:MAG: LemA family protein [Candidatus Eisenbacteria bacterium]|uniref:LemA family protein n=1 Tax=Eiseniibacteriota bacterium TaxID=2212470 RepID=A0A7Y2EB58_UNCEI|nr:LemA family protein [Candidatus Eisenbacteria bacterium]
MELMLLIALSAIVIFFVFVFNRLVSLRNRAAGSWSDIDVQLKRRHDLVDNLVETVRGYVSHERETLERVVQMRSRAGAARETDSPEGSGKAETELGGGVGQLFALAEGYPDLKASERFADLHRGLVELEDDLQNARRYYNAVVRDFNTRIQSFPDLIVANLFRFTEREFFSLSDPSEALAPKVELP